MKSYQPPTILHLILLGYVVVLLPLGAAIIRGAKSMDQISQGHRDNMAEVVSITQATELLSQELIDLERVARQFSILGESALHQVLQNRVADVQDTLNRLDRLAQSIGGVGPLLQSMNTQIMVIQQAVGESAGNDSARLDRELLRFESLNRLYDRLRLLLQEDFQRRVIAAEDSAEQTRVELLVLGLAILPGTLALVAVFTNLIARPVKQLKRAIRSLGDGNYQKRYELQGPRDLQSLAIQLNWLADRLATADSEKKRFLRHISHELKTPLSTLKEGTELLKDEVPGPLSPSQREVVQIIHRGVESFQGLINNLLDYNLLTSGVPVAHPGWFSLKEIVSEILQPHRLTAERKKIQLFAQGPDMEVFLDRSMLRAALDNLISNAIHYSPEVGEVRIMWQPNKDMEHVKIEVQDTGPGIPPAERDKVFLPFFQGKARKQGPLKGTGLGLSVAKECTESLQGKIRILDSKVGALFQLTLPVHLGKDATQ
ncbi:MAG: ATP-binding protein [Oligoflexus sp.]